MDPDEQQSDRQKGDAARAAVRALDRAALATLMAKGGAPYASLVLTACDPAGNPLMLLSDLAEHTKNLKACPEASLLFDATAGLDNALTGTRITLQGTVRQEPPDGDLADRYLARYVARHPDAELYAGFGDFNLYRIQVERVHVVAGFGQIHWLAAEHFLTDMRQATALTAAEPEILVHMNADHADALRLYATQLDGNLDGVWQMSGIDCDGFDLRLGGARARIPFESQVFTADDARKALAGLVKTARKMAETR